MMSVIEIFLGQAFSAVLKSALLNVERISTSRRFRVDRVRSRLPYSWAYIRLRMISLMGIGGLPTTRKGGRSRRSKRRWFPGRAAGFCFFSPFSGFRGELFFHIGHLGNEEHVHKIAFQSLQRGGQIAVQFGGGRRLGFGHEKYFLAVFGEPVEVFPYGFFKNPIG